MKILFVVPGLNKTGPNIVVYNIIKYLDRQRFEPIVLRLLDNKRNTFLKQFEELNIPIYSMNLSTQGSLFFSSKKIKSAINKIDPDIIHSHCTLPDCFCAIHCSEKNLISTIHNNPFNIAYRYGNFFGKIILYFHISMLKRIRYRVACSKTLAVMLSEKHNIKFDYVGNGVDTDNFKPGIPKNKAAIRKKLNLPDDKIILISVGALSALKDPVTIIKAFKNSKLAKKACLLFLGDGDLFDECNRLIAEDNIRMPGKVKNVLPYLQSADYFISASHTEGLPNSVLEAFACGLPVILSDIPPHKEFFELNGKNTGKLFESSNIEQLIRLFNGVPFLDYVQMVENTQKLVKGHLSAQIMAEEYMKIYIMPWHSGKHT